MISYSSGNYTFREHRRFGSVSQTASNRSGRGVWSDRGLFNVFVSSSLLEAQCISTIRAAIQEVSGNALSKFSEACPGEFPARSPRGRRLRQSGNRSCQIHKMILLVVGQLSAWGASPVQSSRELPTICDCVVGCYPGRSATPSAQSCKKPVSCQALGHIH